jgi:hypothetical protein
MLLSGTPKTKFYHYGLKAGLPFSLLEGVADTLDALDRPTDYYRRREMAKTVTRDSVWKGYLTREMGLTPFSRGDIPGLEDIHLLAQKVYRERKDEIIRSSRGFSEYNPFYFILHNEDIHAYPEFVEAAISPALIEIISDYLGTVPRLQHINMWMARPSDSTYGSQLFHLDKPDVHFVRVFINVFPCTPENGPTTVLPASLSEPARKGSEYERVYYSEDGRLSDKELLKHCSEDDLLTLPPEEGAGGICDTSTCLHFGSRCRSGERVTLVFNYALAHKINGSPTRELPRPANMTPAQEMMLDAF